MNTASNTQLPNPREDFQAALAYLADHYAGTQREAAAEMDVVVDFLKTAPLPGVKARRVYMAQGSIFVEVTDIERVPGHFPGSTVRSPQAKGSIAAISNSAPTRSVNVVTA